MMDNTDALNAFMNAVKVEYNPPVSMSGGDLIKRLDAIRARVATSDRRTIERAQTLLPAICTKPTTPTSSDVMRVLAQAYEDVSKDRKKAKYEAIQKHGYGKKGNIERNKFATEMLQSDLARESAEGGWLISLFEFCLEKMVLPNAIEQADMIEKTRQFNRDLEEKLKEYSDDQDQYNMLKITQATISARKERLRKLKGLIKEEITNDKLSKGWGVDS